jgi:hypothetical protein
MAKLYDDNPAAFAEFVAWVMDTKYGEVTLRFQGGKFCMVEQTRRANGRSD